MSSSDDDEDYLIPYAWSPLALRDSCGAAAVAMRMASGSIASCVDREQQLIRALPFGQGHSLHDGPPYLRCNVGWGHALCFACGDESSELDEAVVSAVERRRLLVSVDWGLVPTLSTDETPIIEVSDNEVIGPFALTARIGGATIASTQCERRGDQLQLPLDLHNATIDDGVSIVVALMWRGGSRHLHTLPPLRGGIRLDGLVAAPCDTPPSPAMLVAAPALTVGTSAVSRIESAEGGAPTRAPRTAAAGAKVISLERLERGFGVEIELITNAAHAAARPSGSTSKAAEWRELVEHARAIAAAEETSGGAADVASAPSALDVLERCARWAVMTDNHIMSSPRAIGEMMVRAELLTLDDAAACTGASTKSGNASSALAELARLKDKCDWVVDVASGGDAHTRAHKTELTSPPPPHELSFAHGAVAELCCATRLVRSLGATAPSISRVWHGGASMHVHVNVANPLARGVPLSAREILNVIFSWIRFDLVISRLARPWFWREPSSAPLYATGAEFSWSDSGFEQGHRPSPLSPYDYDVPRFVRGVRAVLRGRASRAEEDAQVDGREGTCDGDGAGPAHQQAAHRCASISDSTTGDAASAGAAAVAQCSASSTAAFDALPAAEQLERLFGGAPKGAASDSPGSRLGRHGSLNLRRLTSYGTLEFRRCHGTLDEARIVRWPAFCTAFVEAFRTHSCAPIVGIAPRADEVEGEAPLHTPPFAPVSVPCDDPGLTHLQVAQERATVEELVQAMGDHIEPSCIQWLLDDAIARRPGSGA